MSNTQLFVLDTNQQPVPIGVAGELHIGGAGVAKGYLNLPELTAQKFVASPFDATQRLYRSGDRVRWLADGNLEFLGRLDDQVKVRGFRIELGDIESRLRQIAGVREAAVAVHGDGPQARLVAYVVGDEFALVETARDGLADQLPDYLQPSAYVQLERLPLTLNGKVDRKALPEPGAATETFVEPAGDTEQRLAAIWAPILRQDRISADANFFALGGHSLLATRIVSEIAKQFGKPVPVRALFEHSTVRKLATYLDAQTASGYAAIPRQPRDGEALPLSFAQQRLWFIDRLEGGSRQYNMPAALRLRGALDTTALQGALDAIVARHEILRTRYVEVDGQPRQVVDAPVPVVIATTDLSTLSEAQREERVLQLARDEAAAPFDLARDPMLRCHLVRLAHEEHALLFTLHHIASDGWSNGILVKDFVAFYTALRDGVAPAVAPLRVQYADYAAWQHAQLRGDALARGLDYWRRQLAGIPAVHSLPLDKPRPAQQRFQGQVHEHVIDAELADAIRAFCRARDVTPFVFVQTALAVLIGRFSRETDIVLGMPIAGRAHADTENLIGFFVNTLVLRTDLSDNPDFDTLLARSRRVVLEADSHQHIPFDMLVDELKPARSLSHNPLVQILVNSFEAADDAPAPVSGLAFEPLRAGGSADLAKADLTLYTRSLGEQLYFKWSYRSSLFEAATIARLAESLAVLLREVVRRPQTPVQDIVLLDAVQADAVLDAAQPQRHDYAALPLHLRIAAFARSRPQQIAFDHDGRTITYAALDADADALARVLVAHGAGPGGVVAVLADRGIAYATGVLAALKTGAAYAPLAGELPDARLAHMLRDSGACVLLQQDRFAGRLDTGLPTISLDALPVANGIATDWPVPAAGAASHVLYTSGSTGEPKGVVGTHDSLINRVDWMHERFPFAPDDVCCLITSTAFVRAVWELFVPLAGGQKTVVFDAERITDLQGFLDDLGRHGVTRIVTAPTLARALIDLPDATRQLSRLRYWFVSGEPLKCDVARRITAVLPQVTLCNLYGSTETMSDVSYQVVDVVPDRATVPIGRAIANSALLVLDGRLRPVPPGMPGEICIAGANLARGYLNQPALTQERFPEHALGREFGERVYRTGDLGRVLADGTVECLGRMDYQVKVRGFRIELGEIEARLLRSDRVKEAVLRVMGDADAAHLVAYIVPEHALDEAGLDALRRELREWLPDYMQPAAFVVLDAFPLTPNGKVNRRALPEPDYAAQRSYRAPEGATQIAIAEVWAQLLKHERVSSGSNFFELGGHSLLATRVASAIAAQLGKDVPVRAIFEHADLCSLARYVDEEARSASARIPFAPRDLPLPLSFAQQRLWFVDRFEGGSVQYNMPVAMRLTGALDIAALQRALDAIVARHEVLRTVYVETGGSAVQRISPAVPVLLARLSLRDLSGEERERAIARLSHAEARRPFDLAADLMLRCSLVELGDDDHVILFTMHHIASDGWSKGVLVKEFAALYAAFVAGDGSPLLPLPLQYADYAHWQRSPAQAEVLQRDLAYWQRQLADLPQVHGLPLDRPRPARQAFGAQRLQIQIDADLTQRLRVLAREHDATLFMLLQSAFALLIGRWSNETDVVLGTPIAGRVAREIEPLIGFFVNSLVLRTDLSGDPSFAELLARGRQTALDAFAHQSTSFEMLVETLKPERHLSHAPLYQIVIALQNHERNALSLPGLTIDAVGSDAASIDVDLHLAIAESADGLHLRWLYADSLFDAATIARFAESFATLLSSIVDAPTQSVQSLPLLPAAD
ncbi:MAG TPA: amino acid adenylation domain-containing protein, partial [Tahibacter sp.]|uniref:non-ribosomal peptide synthetase n=1 Tax=Tahibacter sp. TaxID=2056211 RepID=UPI002B58420A